MSNSFGSIQPHTVQFRGMQGAYYCTECVYHLDTVFMISGQSCRVFSITALQLWMFRLNHDIADNIEIENYTNSRL